MPTLCSVCDGSLRPDAKYGICQKTAPCRSANNIARKRANLDPEKIREQSRRQYSLHRDRILARNKRWQKSNPTKYREAIRAWEKQNPEKIKASADKRRKKDPEAFRAKVAKRMKKWRSKNPDLAIARTKEWRKKYPERARADKRHQSRKRRAIKNGLPCERFTLEEIMDRDGGKCCHCRKAVRTTGNPFHPLYANLDHIIPLSKGGPTTRANTQILCSRCNGKKRNKSAGEQLRLIG